MKSNIEIPKVKVLFIVDRLGAGGKERQLVELLKGLTRAKRITCQLIVLSSEIHYLEILDLDIPIHRIKRTGKLNLQVFRKVYVICKSFRPDIIHSWESVASLYVLPTTKLLGVKLINSIIRNAPNHINRFSQTWLRTRLLMKFSDLILANSQAGLESYQIPQHKSHCIYNGFDFNRIDQLQEEEVIKLKFNISKPKVVGMVGKFTDKKDYNTFLAAALKVLSKRTDIDFITIGEGKNLRFCKVSFEHDNIHFLGNQKDVESIINIFDIGVLATYTEGISNSIMEYMALGKPVIATDGGGTNEILIDGETGFLVNQMDVNDLTNRIELLLEESDLAMQMGRRGKDRLYKEFNLERLTEHMMNLYQNRTKI